MAIDEIESLDELAEGDLVLFEGKKQPLEVVSVSGGKVQIQGPHGGEYVLFEEEDRTIVCSSRGSRRYATPAKNLHTVGKWKQLDEDAWKHSRTGATVEVKENEIGKWIVEADGVELEEEIGYGYMEKGLAEKHAKKILKNNPEG